MTPADWAWIGLAAGVGVWDLAAPPGQTLTAGIGRHHSRRPWVTRLAVGYVAAHLLGWLPKPIDLLHHASQMRYPMIDLM